MNNKKFFRSLFISFLMVLSVPGIYSQQIREISFEGWAKNADVYFLGDGNDLSNFAGTLRGDDAGRVLKTVPPRDFLPWTQQLRIGGFAVTGSGLTIGVNRGYPLSLQQSPSGKPVFAGPGDEAAKNYLDLSAGRTLGSMFTKGGQVYFHLYADDMFGSQGSGPGLDPAGPYLIGLDWTAGGGGRVSALDLAFADSAEAWEPVEFISTPSGALVSWKYSDDKKTRFRYLRHSNDGKAEKEIDEDYFRDGYSLLPFNDAPFALRGLIRAVREQIIGGRLDDAADLFLELSAADAQRYSDNYPAFFYDPAGGGAEGRRIPVILPASGSESLWYVLYDNSIIRCGENISLCSLPELPEGFKYTGIWTDGAQMILSWEEARFPFIGRSGMMYISMRDIILD